MLKWALLPSLGQASEAQTFSHWASCKAQTQFTLGFSKAQTRYCTQQLNRAQMELAMPIKVRVFFSRELPGVNEIDLSSLPKRQSSPLPQAQRRRLFGGGNAVAALAVPRLRSAVLCLGGANPLRVLRALRDVRQHGLAAHFQRARGGHHGLAVPFAPLSHLSLRSVPQSFFFRSHFPPHRAAAASDRPEIGIASFGDSFLTVAAAGPLVFHTSESEQG